MTLPHWYRDRAIRPSKANSPTTDDGSRDDTLREAVLADNRATRTAITIVIPVPPSRKTGESGSHPKLQLADHHSDEGQGRHAPGAHPASQIGNTDWTNCGKSINLIEIPERGG
jgi:hypothetical protein